MIIDIDTIKDQAEIYLLDDTLSVVSEESIRDRQQVAEKVLQVVHNLLKQGQKSTADIKMVLVNLGPGSYTGQRIGVTTANLLAFSLGVPVVGYEDNGRGDAISQAKKQVVTGFVPVSPIYSNDPKITERR